MQISDVRVDLLRVLGEGKEPRRPYRFEEHVEIVVHGYVGIFAIVETGPTQPRVFEVETERPDQMQPIPGIDAQAHEIPRVRRDLWSVKNDVKHFANSVLRIHCSPRTDFSRRRRKDKAGSV